MGDMGSTGGEAIPGQSQSGADQREFEPNRLLGIEAQEALVEFRQEGEISIDSGTKHRVGARHSLTDRQVFDQSIDDRQDVANGVITLEVDDGSGDIRGDKGIAVAVTSDPGAKGERCAVRGQIGTDQSEGRRQVIQDFRQGSAGQVIEIVEGVASLIEDPRALQAELICLPEQIHEFTDSSPSGVLIKVVIQEQVGDTALLGEDGAPGCLGGMSGEYRPHGHGLSQMPHLRCGHSLLAHPARHAGEQAALLATASIDVTRTLHLFGDVSQVEVDREGSSQEGGCAEVEVIDEVRGTIRILAHRPADRFDEVKEGLPFVADQSLTQQDAQPADVIAQRGIEVSDGIRGSDGHGEDASVRHPLGSSRGHDRPRLAHGQLLR